MTPKQTPMQRAVVPTPLSVFKNVAYGKVCGCRFGRALLKVFFLVSDNLSFAHVPFDRPFRYLDSIRDSLGSSAVKQRPSADPWQCNGLYDRSVRQVSGIEHSVSFTLLSPHTVLNTTNTFGDRLQSVFVTGSSRKVSQVAQLSFVLP